MNICYCAMLSLHSVFHEVDKAENLARKRQKKARLTVVRTYPEKISGMLKL